MDIVIPVLAFLAGIIATVLFIATRKSDNVTIQRSAYIAAAPSAIFPLINDLRAHTSWSPFVQDPNMQRTYSGPSKGVGSAMDFDDRKAGTGRIEITDASQPNQVVFRLVMTKPMNCDNVIKLSLTPRGGGTDVSWSMSGRTPFLAKLMGTVMDCEGMCGGMFEKGLASLKTLTETGSAREVA
ncbi:MAG TPA: SRPBCC family protein [Pseudorhodoplanes sp.]|nr:SRPBCC family protein [Pseudorhodoplanes sp.]